MKKKNSIHLKGYTAWVHGCSFSSLSHNDLSTACETNHQIIFRKGILAHTYNPRHGQQNHYKYKACLIYIVNSRLVKVM